MRPARSSLLSARIISRIASMRLPSKNMCSVRQRPIPSAPKATAFSTWSGVSAFVRTPSFRKVSTQFISFANWPIDGALFRRERLIDQNLNNFGRRSRHFAGKDLSAASIDRNEVPLFQGRAVRCQSALLVIDLTPIAPQTQTFPICRATRAACEETPPRAVRIPSAAIMPLRSSGDVSIRASTTFSPFSERATASAGAKYDLPGGRTRSGRQSTPDFLRVPDRFAVENGSEQVSKRVRRNALHCVLFRNQLLLHHLHRNPNGGMTGPLAVSRLQDVKPVCLRP